jgi:iron complex outermembrane receptor protein
VVSDLAYLTGTFNTGGIRHEVVIGSTGYRFASYSPVTSPPKTALCTAYTPQGICQANIANPIVFFEPPTGIFSYTKTSPSTGIYGSSIIRQQGFSFGDTITLTPRWLVRLAASQDWTWTDTYTATAATGYQRTLVPGGYVNQGVSPSASLMFKPRSDMTIYATFADSIQAPDVASANSGSIVIINANQALPPYRSKEGEIGYKLRVRRMTASVAAFRIDRPFANYATGVVDPICGAQSGTPNCEAFRITGNQRNYGVETMLSGRIINSLMITGGLTVLSPKLTDTGIAATNNRNFVGIPDFKSNILAEYRLPKIVGAYFNFDWQHVGRRPIDDINSAYTPQYNLFDFGVRYTTHMFEKPTTWRVTVNNITDVHYWSTLGPGSITGQSTGSYLGHLGEPRLVTASVRFDF